MDEFSFKELNDVILKATFPLCIGNRQFEEGEVVAAFDKIFLANIDEIKSIASSTGGYDNAKLITWETVKEISINFSQGVFSKSQLALLTNSKMVSNETGEKVIISKRQNLNSNENCELELKYEPKTIFIYDEEYNKLSFEKINDKTYQINEPFKKVIVDYTFEYTSKSDIISLGKALTTGFLELEGKTRYKDDKSGQVKTGIIKIPRLRLMSELSIRLGEYTNPVVGTLRGVGYPVGTRGSKVVMEMYFLDDDIDSDV